MFFSKNNHSNKKYSSLAFPTKKGFDVKVDIDFVNSCEKQQFVAKSVENDDKNSETEIKS